MLYADMLHSWFKDIEPLVAMYMLPKPIDDLSRRVRQLCEQHKEREKKRSGMQKERGEVMNIQDIHSELEEGEIRETPLVKLDPSKVCISSLLDFPVTSN